VFSLSFVFSFRRPTREKSYFCELKNMFSKSDRELSSVGGSPAQAPVDSMSASSCVWIGSFFSVADRTGPISSRSGKKISSRSTFFSCAMEITRGVSSSLASG